MEICWLLSACFLVLLSSSNEISVEPRFQFGAILDAGSTSTKIRLYNWREKESLDEVPVINEVHYKKVKQGISAFSNNIHGIQQYLVNILHIIAEVVPESQWSSTPVYFMATAGLRLLDEAATKAILDEVASVFSSPQHNPFLFESDFARILSGEEEAVYAWLSVNYLSGFFNAHKSPQESVGIVEIGGGSAQIAFIPEDPIYAGKMPVVIGGKNYAVYTHSYLSYGASAMHTRIEEHLVRENPAAAALVNPCMLREDRSNVTNNGKSISLSGGGNASQCEDVLGFFLKHVPDYMCSPKPCGIGQVYSPPIKHSDFLAIGVIYATAKELGMLKYQDTLDLKEMRTITYDLCSKSLSEAVELGFPPRWASFDCQNGLYIPMMMSALGFSLGDEPILVAKEIDGVRVAWGLGAMLYEEERLRYKYDVPDNTIRNRL